MSLLLVVVIIVLCIDRGVEYECRVSAKNAIDFGTPAVATIHTPEGGETRFIFREICGSLNQITTEFLSVLLHFIFGLFPSVGLHDMILIQK